MDNGLANQPEHAVPPIALTIAGSDPSGGAGVQGDLKTFAALDVYGVSVITALTAQSTRQVRGIHPVPARFVAQQIEVLLGDLSVSAIKIGMLPNAAVIAAVVASLSRQRARPVILDPVLVASSGDRLLADKALPMLAAKLCPCTDLLTPNLREAATLLHCRVASDRRAMQDQAQALLKLGSAAVLLKGGHAHSVDAADVLVTRDQSVHWFESRRIVDVDVHGTGCALSAAIAAQLAKGSELVQAIADAKAYVTAAIASATNFSPSGEVRTLQHFHAIRPLPGTPF